MLKEKLLNFLPVYINTIKWDQIDLFSTIEGEKGGGGRRELEVRDERKKETVQVCRKGAKEER